MGEISELLPCPFCGGEDITISSWDVKCGTCGTAMPGSPTEWNRRAEARQAPLPAGTVTEEAWHYTINYGPDGEENYANVYTPDGEFVGNLKIHHARAIVSGLNEATFAARPALDEAEQKRYFDAGWEKAKLLLKPEDPAPGLVEALRRIKEATPENTNSAGAKNG